VILEVLHIVMSYNVNMIVLHDNLNVQIRLCW